MDELTLIIGARVYGKNGKCGRLSQVVVDPDTWRVTHIIVEEGFLQRRSRVFPISTVAQATTGDIYLPLDDEELNNYPEYNEGIVKSLALITVEQGMPIEHLEGEVGWQDYLLVRAGDGLISGRVMQQPTS